MADAISVYGMAAVVAEEVPAHSSESRACWPLREGRNGSTSRPSYRASAPLIACWHHTSIPRFWRVLMDFLSPSWGTCDITDLLSIFAGTKQKLPELPEDPWYIKTGFSCSMYGVS